MHGNPHPNRTDPNPMLAFCTLLLSALSQAPDLPDRDPQGRSIAWQGIEAPPRFYLDGLPQPHAWTRAYRGVVQGLPGQGERAALAFMCGERAQVWWPAESTRYRAAAPQGWLGGQPAEAVFGDEQATFCTLALSAEGLGAHLPAQLEEGTPSPSQCGEQVVTLALETDVAFAAEFPDPAAAAAHLGSLVLVLQETLRRDVGIELVVPYVGVYTQSDPWSLEPDAHPAQVLEQFADRWPTVAPVPTHCAHLVAGGMSGSSLVTSGNLCLSENLFAVHGLSASLLGPDAMQTQAVRLLHSLGHQLGARHTTDFCPPLDDCTPLQAAGACQERQACSQGTVMSACHLCPGGVWNTALGFHPANQQNMRAHLAACLPPMPEVHVSAADYRLVGEPWTVDLHAGVALDAQPRLHVQPLPASTGSPTAFEVNFTPVSGSRYRAWLPPAHCGVHWQASVILPTTACGLLRWPDGPSAAPLSNRVFALQTQWTDDGTLDRGWLSFGEQASAGWWTRGVPVADEAWPFAPLRDAGGDGWCYLTGNRMGNSDVDDGTVRLQSPSYSLPEGPFDLRFDYFLGLANENGNDHLLLEVRFDQVGPWTTLWQVEQDSEGAWRSVQLDWQELWALRAPNSTHAQFRFSAQDGLPPSVVEAGLDNIRLRTSACE